MDFCPPGQAIGSSHWDPMGPEGQLRETWEGPRGRGRVRLQPLRSARQPLRRPREAGPGPSGGASRWPAWLSSRVPPWLASLVVPFPSTPSSCPHSS